MSLDAFLLDCRLRGLSHRTLETYKLRISAAIRVIDPTDPRPSFFSYLESIPNARTRHQAFRCVKTYTRWLAAQGAGQDWFSGWKLKFSEAPVPAPLSQAEVEQILAAIPQRSRRKDRVISWRRDRLLFSALYLTGCRLNAIRTLRWADIEFGQPTTIRYTTKGAKEFCKVIVDSLARDLNAWKLSCPSTEWVFPSISRPKQPICSHYVSHALPRYAKRAGIQRRVWVHLLRHSHASAVAAVCSDFNLLQFDLGHASIATTAKYVSQITAAAKLRGVLQAAFN